MGIIEKLELTLRYQEAAICKPPGPFRKRSFLKRLARARLIEKFVAVTATSFICILVPSVFGDQEIDATSWQKMGKFEPTMLSKTLGDHAGQLVAVQFNFRGKDVRHIKPNWYEGSIWQPDATAKKKFSNVRVLFAKKDLEAFKSITTDSTSHLRLTLYGRVERDADNHFFFVRVLGRKAAVDSAGNAMVTW